MNQAAAYRNMAGSLARRRIGENAMKSGGEMAYGEMKSNGYRK
jgi:hypothetical protein